MQSDSPISWRSRLSRSLHGVVTKSPKLYRYQSLETPRSLRLLRVSAGLGWSHIKPSIVVSSLDDPNLPKYIALSHAWGPTFNDGSHLSEMFECDAGVIKITRSVHAALNCIADVSPSLELGEQSFGHFRYLWIDSICINQLDIVERSAQVALMPGIYARCFGLIVWLGEQSPTLGLWGKTFTSALPSLHDAMLKLHYSNEKVPDGFLEMESPASSQAVDWVDFHVLEKIRAKGPLANRVVEAYSSLRPDEKKLADRLLYYPPVQYEELCHGGCFAVFNHPDYRADLTDPDDLSTAYRGAYADLVQAD